MNITKHINLKRAIASALLAGSMAAQAAQNITAAEAEQINAELAPVANPEANAEKVGSVPEGPSNTVGTQFTYQGTLRLGNDRANGPYDFRFKLYTQLSGGTQLGPTLASNDLPVTDGLFSTGLNFGQNPIDGDDIFLEIQVRDGASPGAFTILSPRQRINATPYAVRALVGGDAGSSSPWTVSGTQIHYTGGNVGIGTTNPGAPLHVKSTAMVPARFDGGINANVRFSEQGAIRGYVGSFQTGPGTNDADFEIGTSSNNTAGSMHITTKATPRITVKPNGRVGVGTVSPLAQLHVKGSGGTDPLRVGVNGDIFRVHADGHSRFNGDVQQGIQFGGTLKAAIVVSCGGAPGTSANITRSYNGVTGNPIFATHIGPGKCVITFPFNVNQRFWSVAIPANAGTRYGTCVLSAVNQLRCARVNTQTGDFINGGLQVMLF